MPHGGVVVVVKKSRAWTVALGPFMLARSSIAVREVKEGEGEDGGARSSHLAHGQEPGWMARDQLHLRRCVRLIKPHLESSTQLRCHRTNTLRSLLIF